MPKIALLLDFLVDGKWHGMQELQEVMQVDELQAREIASFLKDYGLARMDTKAWKVRLASHFRRFLLDSDV